MTLKVLLAVLVMGLFGCTKHNPLSCCDSAIQCASFGLDQITGCEGLNVCDSSGTCVSPECETSAECTSPDAPICSNQLCVASCSSDDACTSALPHCSAGGTCVECVDSTQCPTEAPICSSGTCVVSAPPDGGSTHVCPHELLFQRGGLFGGQVIRVSLDDFVEHPLGDQSVSALYGAYSPDATRVVLVQGGTTLWVMDIDGGNAHQIDTQAALLTYPQWSPDGTRIAYGAIPTTSGQPAAIWIASQDGISKTNITPLADAEGPLEWSPDGSKIAFASERTGDSDVFTMNPDGSSQFNVTNRTHDDGLDGTHWSPDGQQLTFTGYFSVWRMNADGSNGESLSGGRGGQPTWGSNGLIYFSTTPDDAAQLFVINAMGTNQHALTTDTFINVQPVLSPDATMIAWSRTESTGTHEQIWVANADGSNPVRVTNNTSDSSSPVWHPCTP